MTTVTYSFEGGTNGATVASGTGAGTGDTNFDVVSSAGATNIYDNTRAAHGTLSNKIATTTSQGPNDEWTTSIGTQTTVYVRAYLYFTAAPTVQHRVLNFVGSAASRGTCLATTAGTLIFTNAAGTTILTSAAFPTGNWFRVEAQFTGSATTGQWIYKIWYQPDAPAGSTPSDTQTSAANLNTGGTLDTYKFGMSSAVVNAGPIWLDDLGVSTTGFIGPAATQIPAPAQLPPVRRRTSARGTWTLPVTLNANAAPGILGAANTYPHLTVARRTSARGWFSGGAGPGNAVPGTQAWVPKPLVSRRTPARGLWRGTVTTTTNLLNGSQPGCGLVRRRTAARTVWRGMVISTVNPPAINGTTQPRAAIPVPRRTAARATWHGTVTGTVNAHGGAVPAPGQQPRISRRTATRAYWYGTPARVTYPPAPRTVHVISGVPHFRWTTGTPVLG